jgi:hypothetical protein
MSPPSSGSKNKQGCACYLLHVHKRSLLDPEPDESNPHLYTVSVIFFIYLLTVHLATLSVVQS